MKRSRKQPRAFTLVELLVVIAIIAVLAAIQLPALANTKAKVQRVYCSGNLKRVGIAFRTWAESRNGRMPMAVSPSQGGASSAVGVRGNGATFAANYPVTGPRGVFGMFVVMSNELTTPKILYCPADSDTAQGVIFGNSSATNTGFFSDYGASYFVGVDASDLSPNVPLAGDANLGDSSSPPSGNNIYGESSSTRKFISLGTNTAWSSLSVGWADNQHAKRGNVTFADGSVQNLNTSQFREALNKSGSPVNTSVAAGGSAFTVAVGSAANSIGINRLQFP